MRQKLPPNEMELYHRVDEVLHYLWYPIGVAAEPDARDEYHSYLPRVYMMLKEGKDIAELDRYLAWVRIERMGLFQGPAKEVEVVQVLTKYRSKLLVQD